MDNKKITGIGCFAKPAMLNQVFKKVVCKYTLGSIDGSEGLQGPEAGKADGAELLKAFIAGKAVDFDSSNFKSSDLPENKKITGFFLALQNQRLKLSIFAKDGGRKPKIYTTSLDELTRMRQQRLH